MTIKPIQVVLTFALLLAVVLAQTNYTFVPDEDNEYSNPDNWQPSDPYAYPVHPDGAIIPSTCPQTVILVDNNFQPQTIYLGNSDAPPPGECCNGATMIVEFEILMFGTFYGSPYTTINFTNSVTITTNERTPTDTPDVIDSSVNCVGGPFNNVGIFAGGDSLYFGQSPVPSTFNFQNCQFSVSSNLLISFGESATLNFFGPSNTANSLSFRANEFPFVAEIDGPINFFGPAKIYGFVTGLTTFTLNGDVNVDLASVSATAILGSGQTNSQDTFIINGDVNVNSGTLQITAVNLTSTGRWNIASGAVLQFQGNAHPRSPGLYTTVSPSSFSGPGTVQVNTATNFFSIANNVEFVVNSNVTFQGVYTGVEINVDSPALVSFAGTFTSGSQINNNGNSVINSAGGNYAGTALSTSAGSVTISGPVTVASFSGASSQLLLSVQSATQFDKLSVSGSWAYTGSVVISGSAPSGSTLQVIQFSTTGTPSHGTVTCSGCTATWSSTGLSISF